LYHSCQINQLLEYVKTYSQPDEEQDNASYCFTPLLELLTKTLSQFQTQKRHTNAGDGNYPRCKNNWDMVETQSKANYKVIDTKCQTEEKQLLKLCGKCYYA